MSVRITVIPEPGQTVIRIDGWLKGAETEELVRTVLDVEGPTALDLTELQSVDRESVAVLQTLLARGTKVQAASPYIRLLLTAEAGSPGQNRGEPT